MEHPIVGEVAIPTDFAFFSGKAFPGKGGGQWRKRLTLTALSGTLVGRAMHPRIDALAPGVRLTIEIIDIGERDSCPETLLDDADRPLDLALRLGSPKIGRAHV